MMQLPKHWFREPTSKLKEWLDNNTLSEWDADRVIIELDDRDRQADANKGLINGLAPERSEADGYR